MEIIGYGNWLWEYHVCSVARELVNNISLVWLLNNESAGDWDLT